MAKANRTFWYKKNLYDSQSPTDDGISPIPALEEDANLVASLDQFGTHMPVIDIDYDAELVPSSTLGHFHLYLNKQVKWPAYLAVLKAMEEAGLIQAGFYNWSKERGMSMVRRPGIKKFSRIMRYPGSDDTHFWSSRCAKAGCTPS